MCQVAYSLLNNLTSSQQLIQTLTHEQVQFSNTIQQERQYFNEQEATFLSKIQSLQSI